MKRWLHLLLAVVLVSLLVTPGSVEAANKKVRYVAYKTYLRVVNLNRTLTAHHQVDHKYWETELQWQEHQSRLKDIRLQELLTQIEEAGMVPCPSSVTP